MVFQIVVFHSVFCGRQLTTLATYLFSVITIQNVKVWKQNFEKLSILVKYFSATFNYNFC